MMAYVFLRAGTNMRKIACALLAICMCVAGLVNAQDTSDNFKCVAMGKPGAKVRSNGVIIDLPAILDKCDGSVALADEINICFRDVKKQRKCAEFKKNQTISLRGLAASAGEGVSGVVLSMARGDVQTLAGQTRSASISTLGMPYGPVVAPNEELLLGLALDPKLAKVTNVQIARDGSQEVLINQSINSATTKLSISNLPRDIWYRWTIEVDGKRISGKFLYVGTVMNPVRSELDEVNKDSQIDPQAKAYLRADIFNENGLVYERSIAINEFKLLSK